MCVGLGAVLGVVGARLLWVGSGWSLLPWALAGVAIGWTSHGQAWRDGAIFGFALAFVFMVIGYDGGASLLTRVPAFLVLGLVGACCGAILAVLGGGARRTERRHAGPHDGH